MRFRIDVLRDAEDSSPIDNEHLPISRDLCFAMNCLLGGFVWHDIFSELVFSRDLGSVSCRR
jgi:hypothetical protein